MECLDLDRVTPTRPPANRSPSGHQGWRDLLFVHYRLPLEEVRALVPAELELDPWEDAAWVGLVPFQMVDIRPTWLPSPFAMTFLETNLRTYVHHRGEPGVYFFSLEASSRLAVTAARLGWGLPYHHATMATSTIDGITSYETTRGSNAEARLAVKYRTGDELGASKVGTLEHFLLERYYLFSLRGRRVFKGHVHHVPYPAAKASVLEMSDGLIAAAGMTEPRGLPEVAHFSRGVDVEVFGPWELD